MKFTEAEAMQRAAALIEQRLVKTTSFYGRPPKALDDYQRGIEFALSQALMLLREWPR